jgi:hypothetical protein
MEMPEIKFSNVYAKFMDRKPVTARLMQVFKVLPDEISWSFREYDTVYYEKDGRKCNYVLPQTLLMVLLFRDNFRRVWTTIRRFVIDKWKYYKTKEGEVFRVVFTKQERKA